MAAAMVRRGNRKYHDRVAGRYDAVYDRPYWRFYRDLSWRHLKPFLPRHRPARAADLGCGTGWFGRKLLHAGCDVVFLDPSGKMIEAARKAVDEAGRRGREAEFVQGEMEDLSAFGDASLDFATAQGDPLSFCEDPRRALAELRRTVKDGAAVVLSVDHRTAGLRLFEKSPTPDALLDLLRTGRSQWLAQRADESFPMKMFDPDELHSLLRKAGFEPRSTIGKTCLVQRATEAWLEDAEQRRRLQAAEEKVHGLPHYWALASHLQVAATAT